MKIEKHVTVQLSPYSPKLVHRACCTHGSLRIVHFLQKRYSVTPRGPPNGWPGQGWPRLDSSGRVWSKSRHSGTSQPLSERSESSVQPSQPSPCMRLALRAFLLLLQPTPAPPAAPAAHTRSTGQPTVLSFEGIDRTANGRQHTACFHDIGNAHGES